MHYIGKHKDLKKKVVTEWTEVSDLLKLYHSSSIGGHSGVNNTLAKISANYTWSMIKEFVREYVS